MRWVISILLLTSVYLLMLISLNPWDIVVGLLLSTVLVLLFRSYIGLTTPSSGPGAVERLRWIVPFILHTAWDITVSALQVALMVMHVRPLARMRFIEIPFDDDTAAGVALNALLTTLSPGAVMIDIDWERRVTLFHVFDNAELSEIRRIYRDFYERYQRHVLP